MVSSVAYIKIHSTRRWTIKRLLGVACFRFLTISLCKQHKTIKNTELYSVFRHSGFYVCGLHVFGETKIAVNFTCDYDILQYDMVTYWSRIFGLVFCVPYKSWKSTRNKWWTVPTVPARFLMYAVSWIGAINFQHFLS